MPFYDYQCVGCDRIQEERHSITETPEIKCNYCAAPCKRLMPGDMNYILRGDGWNGKRIKREGEKGGESN